MRYRKLDANDDYLFGHSSNDFYVNSPQTVGQAVITRLRLWAGEWFTDTSDGTLWFENILGKTGLQVYETILRQRILETPGVIEITDFDGQFDDSTRMLTVTATINTIYGTTNVSSNF